MIVMAIPFTKMSGSGNDFILIDNRQQGVLPMDLPRFAAQVCQRKMSVGADGLILIEKSKQYDFKWLFLNADGSTAEMCGNGARCAARFAHRQGITGKQMKFETLAGIIEAEVREESVKIKMTDPSKLIIGAKLDTDFETITYCSVNTGVPHVVLEVDEIETAAVVTVGRKVRQHKQFAPAGTNVNFMARLPNGRWAVRTYERGVEDETLACGTGIVAVALVLAREKKMLSPITLETRSRSVLKVYFTPHGQDFKDVYLEGDARIIYNGQLNCEAWQYK
jgi:diaminopimelate epimerase